MRPITIAGQILAVGLCAPNAWAIVAGSATGSPADSPAAHVDANVATSAFAGVGAVLARITPTSAYLGTGTLLDATHVLTAAHVMDPTNDGIRDIALSDITFTLNAAGNYSSVLNVSAVTFYPSFTGFNHPTATNDLAILTLSQPVPLGTPTYSVLGQDIAQGMTLTLVGYGQSGNGDVGANVAATATVKRVGYNVLDTLSNYVQGVAELWHYDFDGPTGNGLLGGSTLGNAIESAIAPGDSGGPAFIEINGQYVIAGTNTFTTAANVGKFGSQGGGIYLPAYADWIDSVVSVPEPSAILLGGMGIFFMLAGRKRVDC